MNFAGFVLRQNKNLKGETKTKGSTSALREQSQYELGLLDQLLNLPFLSDFLLVLSLTAL